MSMTDNDELRLRIRELESENAALAKVLDRTTHEKTELECRIVVLRMKLENAGIEVG